MDEQEKENNKIKKVRRVTLVLPVIIGGAYVAASRYIPHDFHATLPTYKIAILGIFFVIIVRLLLGQVCKPNRGNEELVKASWSKKKSDILSMFAPKAKLLVLSGLVIIAVFIVYK